MFKTRVQTLLKSTEADALYIASPENMRYYSGFTGGEGALILRPDARLLLTDSRYRLQAAQEAPDFTILDITETNPTDCLSSYHPTAIGFEEEFVSAKGYQALSAAMPKCRFLALDQTMLMQRATKDDRELMLTRKAALLADEAFSRLLPLIKPGVSELDLALELEWSMRKGGASAPSFPIICASGKRSAMPHGTATPKKLAAGDFVTMDFGCFYEGYASDMTRTVVLGRASAEQKKIYETVLAAQEAALAMIGAGVVCKDADTAAREVINAAGYGSCFGHALGHGTGLLIHEQPVLSPRSETVLAAGMTVTVEPGVYVENLGGVRIEDLVVITGKGCENLTRSEKALLEL